MQLGATMQEQGFFEAIDLFNRSVNAANWLLDNWWFFPLVFLLYWLFRSIQKTHELLGALDERCQSSFADIDAILSERHGLIPNLVETVKGFGHQEHKVLVDVVEQRAKAMANVGATRFDAENQIGMCLNSFFQLTETILTLQAPCIFRSCALK